MPVNIFYACLYAAIFFFSNSYLSVLNIQLADHTPSGSEAILCLIFFVLTAGSLIGAGIELAKNTIYVRNTKGDVTIPGNLLVLSRVAIGATLLGFVISGLMSGPVGFAGCVVDTYLAAGIFVSAYLCALYRLLKV